MPIYNPTNNAAPISTANPQNLAASASPGSTGTISDAGHVHEFPTASEINALNLPIEWNASTNQPTLTSNITIPNNNSYIVTVAGNTSLSGISDWKVGDILFFNGVWNKISSTYINSPGNGEMLKSDGFGGVTPAVPGVDYTRGTILQCAVPIGMPPAGTITNNGNFTLTTAISTTYSDGLWLYFPENCITGSNMAGYYWTVMSSQTEGKIYNNFFSNAIVDSLAVPYVPNTLIEFSGTTGTAYTPPLSVGGSVIYLYGYLLKGNSIGKNGSITQKVIFRHSKSATSKVFSVKNGDGIRSIFPPMPNYGTTSTVTASITTTYNRGREDRQVSATVQETIAYDAFYPYVNTAVDVIINNCIGIQAATDYIIIEALQVSANPRP